MAKVESALDDDFVTGARFVNTDVNGPNTKHDADAGFYTSFA